jgi:hypothetical protein
MNVKVSEDSSFFKNQHEILKRINLYSHNRFLERADDAIFWNICSSRVVHFAKNLDLDTKHLQPYGVGDTNFWQAWILRMRFYKFCQDNQLAITLNDLAKLLAKYGSAVWKKVKKDGKVTTEEANLVNLFFDQTSKDMKLSDATIEMHELNLTALKDKEDVWTYTEGGIKEVIKKEKKLHKGSVKAEITEYWGFDEDEDSDTFGEYIHQFSYGQGDGEIILFKEEADKEKDYPYFDFHIGEYEGIWLRIGVYERLFQLQERMNTLVNQNAQATEIASLLLMKTDSAVIDGNVLTQAENGQIIPDKNLEQIAIQNPGLANFIQEFNLIQAQADELCLTPQVLTGQDMPTGVPFRGIATYNNNAKEAFTPIRQRIGEKLSHILLNDIFPSLVKDWNFGGIIEIAGDESDIMLYDLSFKQAIKNAYAVDQLLSHGRVVSYDELMAVEAAYDQNPVKDRKLTIPKGYFNFEYGIRLNVTGEQVDKAAKNDASFNALQMIQQNPAIANIPLFKQYCEENGLQYWKLSPAQMQSVQNGATRGAAPMMDKPQRDKLMSEVK